MKKLKDPFFIAPAVAILLFVLFAVIFIPGMDKLGVSDILEFTPESPILAALVFLGLYCLKSVVIIIPVIIIYISSGIMFPTIWAVVLTYFCLFCEMNIGFFIGRKLGGDKVIALLSKNDKMKMLISYHGKNNSTLCFFTRFLPLSLDLVNMFFGAAGTRYGQFIAFSMLGVTPLMIPVVVMGSAAANPLSKEFLIPFAICVAVTLCPFILYQKWLKKNVVKNNS